MLPEIVLGEVRLPTYYLAMFCGFLTMGYLTLKKRDRLSISIPQAVLYFLLLMLSGMLGCKLLYILENWEETLESGVSLGGFSFFGAVFLVPPLMALLGRLCNLSSKRAVDAAAPCVCVMVGPIRVGCFLNGCCGGWMVRLGALTFYWPTQMLESLCDFAILGWLLAEEERGKENLYPRFMTAYGAIRFFIEFLRDTPKDWLGFSHGQVFAALSMLIGLVITIKGRAGHEKRA